MKRVVLKTVSAGGGAVSGGAGVPVQHALRRPGDGSPVEWEELEKEN